MSKSLLPMFSSKKIYHFGSYVYVFDPFGIYFCAWCERVVQFDSFASSCPVFPSPFIEEAVFSPLVYSCFHCHRCIAHISVGSFLGSLFCSIYPCVCFCASTILFWLLWHCSIVWNQGAWYLQPLFFLIIFFDVNSILFDINISTPSFFDYS